MACRIEGENDYARRVADLELCGGSGQALHDELMQNVERLQSENEALKECAPLEYLRVSSSRYYTNLNEINGHFTTLERLCERANLR